MKSTFKPALSRRGFLAGSAAAGAAVSVRPAWADTPTSFTLRAASGRAQLAPEPCVNGGDKTGHVAAQK